MKKSDTVFNQKILNEWQRLIHMKEEDLVFYKKQKNNFMYGLTKKVIDGMKNDYEKISKSYKAS
jgi:hypothetical protein